ncbi:MAG TPA: glycoside hydrolase family 18 protein [Polyangia bacterium]|nr:glycoside hydrolase family 18 protein [Polyangia bacterium]
MRAPPGTIAFAACLAAGCGGSAPATSAGGAGGGGTGAGGEVTDGSAGAGGCDGAGDGSDIDDLSIYAAMAADLDRINVMTYGMAGAYDGWTSWRSSALYQTDSATPTSIDSSVKLYLQAGVPAAKLGIGSGFYGLCYTPPVAAPDQALNGATVAGDDGSLSYANLAAAYDLSRAQRDAVAQVPYLSFATATGPQGCGYVSYEDAQSLADKGAYLKSHALGGVIVWTINEGYLPTAAAGQRSPLLTALGAAVLP